MKININSFFQKQNTPEQKKKMPNLELDNITNNSKTTKIYKEKLKYKENIDLYIKDNTIDFWYSKNANLKKNNLGQTIRSIIDNDLKKIDNTDLFLLNFVADAANSFLKQFNEDRNPHPKSKLNNLKIKKAYVQESGDFTYSSYIDKKVYEPFFYEVLNNIKTTNKIKNVYDFISLLNSWIMDKDLILTEKAFYDSDTYSIYSTGLVFDYYDVKSEQDKATLINDPRFPVLNYVAKINGFKIDKNNPGRLVADIYSYPMLNLYAKEYFVNTQINQIPEKILSTYFQVVDNFANSNTTIEGTLREIDAKYNKFIKKYPFYYSFTDTSNKKENYKKEFETNKIKRNISSDDFSFLRQDGTTTLKKEAIKLYINFRLTEEEIKINNKEIDSLTNTMTSIISINNSKSFLNLTTYEERLYTNTQAINFLETYITSKKIENNKEKKNFVYLWRRGKEYVLPGTEEFAKLVKQDEDGTISSEIPDEALFSLS